MFAVVNPGSLTIVGLQSTTYHHISAGQTRLVAQDGRDVSHLRNFVSIRISQYSSSATYLPLIPSLLLQLPDSSLLRALALVDQTSRKLDAERFDRRPVLQDDHCAWRFRRVLENWCDGDGVDAC